MIYLIVEDDVDNRIPADGAFGEQQRDRAHRRRHRKSGHLDEADHRVGRPRHL